MRARAALAFVILTMVAGIVACAGGSFGSLPNGALPPRLQDATGTNSRIKHVVIVIQENRSFDNFFATFPGADGTRTGKAAAMPRSIAQSCNQPIEEPTTIPLKEVDLAPTPGPAPTWQDLDHLYGGFQIDRDHGQMDGFDLSYYGASGQGGPTCRYTYQYVNPAQIAPYWDMAKQYVLADHTFQTQGSGSFTSHQELIAGGTQIASNEALIDNPSYFPWGCDARTPNPTASPKIPGVVTAIIKRGGKVYEYGGPFPCLHYKTLRDLLDAKSVSWKYYAVAVQKWTGQQHGDTAGIWSAFDAIKAVRYSPEWNARVTRSPLEIFKDISAKRLPAVSWVTSDGANSDHPGEFSKSGQPVDTGPSWVASIVNAIGQSSYWNSTAIVVVWDDWGGYYDHVPPPEPRNWQGGPGFRVPMLIVSPYVKPHVEHTIYEFGSILKFIESIWNLGSLGNNDEHSTSIGTAFDFGMPPRKFKKIPAKYSRDFFLHQQPSGAAPDTE
jgi:phospholipase C